MLTPLCLCDIISKLYGLRVLKIKSGDVLIMEDLARTAMLFDFYGELLNEHQRQIFEAYTMEDLSLAEISAQYGISRQAVSTMISRCRKALDDYEERLHLVKKFESIKSAVSEIHILAEGMKSPDAGKISELAGKILGDL